MCYFDKALKLLKQYTNTYLNKIEYFMGGFEMLNAATLWFVLKSFSKRFEFAPRRRFMREMRLLKIE